MLSSRAVTITKRFLAEFTDILAIRITCPSCKSAVSILPEKPYSVPVGCPHCRQAWCTPEHDQVLVLQGILRVLHERRDPEHKWPCQVHLEYDLPE